MTTLKDGFSEMQVAKGWLVEQIVIEINDPVKEYNPAIITKVVSADNMTLYPGVEGERAFCVPGLRRSVERQYRALATELLEDVDPIEREHMARDPTKSLRETTHKHVRHQQAAH